MFQFYPTNHSVIKAAYGYPCIPYEDLGLSGDTFFSGFFPTLDISDSVRCLILLFDLDRVC